EPCGARGQRVHEVAPQKEAASGSADRKVQSYNFRVCMTKAAENRATFPRPRGYDPARYALLAHMLTALDAQRSKPWSLVDLMKPDPIPHEKTDTNNNGAFSTDFIGGSYDYPEADYAGRARIWQAHADYDQGFLYFLQHDPQVPKGLHDEMAPWGLCQDEFTDTTN